MDALQLCLLQGPALLLCYHQQRDKFLARLVQMRLPPRQLRRLVEFWVIGDGFDGLGSALDEFVPVLGAVICSVSVLAGIDFDLVLVVEGVFDRPVGDV